MSCGPVHHLGSLGYDRQSGWTQSVKRNGLAELDETWVGTYSVSFSLAQGSRHDKFPNLVLMEWTITHLGDDRLAMSLHYEGMQGQGTSGAVTVDRVLDSATSTAPIETNPRFGDVISDGAAPVVIGDIKGGYLLYPDTGAAFEIRTGKFAHFRTFTGPEPEYSVQNPPNPANLNRKAGNTSYKMPTETFTRSFISREWPERTLLGYIANPSDAPPLAGGKDWLLDKVRARSIANIFFECQEVYLGSGPRGWDPDWYDPASP